MSLGLRFYNLQIENGRQYLAKAEDLRAGADLVDPERGDIFFTDKNGNLMPAAIKKEYENIVAVPKDIEDADEAAEILASVLGMPQKEVLAKIGNSGSSYAMILKKAPEIVAKEVKRLKIKGIRVEMAETRFYPYGTLASHVLGFVRDRAGQYGVEAFYNEALVGATNDAASGKWTGAENGEDIQLTIEPNVESQAEKTLAKLVSTYKAEKGLVIVGDPKTGEIWAMAGTDNFDPNNYGASPMGSYLNKSVQEVYEPGSIFKIVTMAAGIDSGKVSPQTTYYDNGSVVVDGYTIENWDHKAHGTMTMAGVIEKSLNTGSIFVMRQMGKKTFWNYIEKFGFNEKTGIDLPGERTSDTKNLKNGGDANYATASFGSGIAVAPIRLWASIASIANKGVMMRPHVVKAEPQEIGRSVSEETAKKVTNMLVTAVDNGKVATISGYTVAGKTGTAFIPDLVHGGYTEDVINTYIGFAPASDPKFMVLIRMDRAAGAPLAGQTIIPAFRELADFILR
ncbi:MAG: penicillin-binding protein 2, partial [Patescibacteria group bacterium]|nr:penicillin-binding protein 2 [Patescibacteria group bacterium]